MFVDFGVSLPLYLFLLLSSSVYLSVCFILCMSLLVSLSLCLSVLLYFFLVFYISFCFALFLSLSISACFVFPPLLCLYQCISFSLPPSLCFCPPTRLSLCLSFFLCSIPLYACLCLSIFLCTIFSASPSLSLFPLSVGLLVPRPAVFPEQKNDLCDFEHSVCLFLSRCPSICLSFCVLRLLSRSPRLSLSQRKRISSHFVLKFVV